VHCAFLVYWFCVVGARRAVLAWLFMSCFAPLILFFRGGGWFVASVALITCFLMGWGGSCCRRWDVGRRCADSCLYVSSSIVSLLRQCGEVYRGHVIFGEFGGSDFLCASSLVHLFRVLSAVSCMVFFRALVNFLWSWFWRLDVLACLQFLSRIVDSGHCCVVTGGGLLGSF